MRKIIDMALGLYEDAVNLEAIATWDKDTGIQEKADVAWSRYEGAKTLLSLVFHIPEETVDDEMELLMTEKVFG